MNLERTKNQRQPSKVINHKQHFEQTLLLNEREQIDNLINVLVFI